MVATWDLWPSNQRYFDAFTELASYRQWAVGAFGGWPHRLGYEVVIDFARANGFAESSEDEQAFRLMMRVQDDAFMEAYRERTKK